MTGAWIVAALGGLSVMLIAPRIFAWRAPVPRSTPAPSRDVPPPNTASWEAPRDSGGAEWAADDTGDDVPQTAPLPAVNLAPTLTPVPSIVTAAEISSGSPPRSPEAGQPAEELDSSPTPQGSPLVVTGYVDFGYAKAKGNGTSFRPGNKSVPADYLVDAFAPAVNSRGDVASIDSGGVFTNGFLPRSVGIAGTPSFLLNTADFDFRYTASDVPVLVFTRVQLLPRLEPTGDVTRVYMEQAFGRLTPFKSAELAISIGKFDSVFGIEYLDNQANFRIGIVPSLLARYTTGESVGAKLFYRYQFPVISSAISFNAAATNSGTFVESLQGPDRSLTGIPVLSGRVGLEQNSAKVSIKVGASGVFGPRNDQQDKAAKQVLWGFDWRIFLPTFTLSGEFINIKEGEGSIVGKQTGAGTFPLASAFQARGFWVQAAEELPLPISPLRLTVYGRYDRRHAFFHEFVPITVDRITTGVNVGVGQSLQVKGELVINRELEGAPQVDNNVYTSSVVWTW